MGDRLRSLVHTRIYLSVCLSVCLSIYLSIYVHTRVHAYTTGLHISLALGISICTCISLMLYVLYGSRVLYVPYLLRAVCTGIIDHKLEGTVNPTCEASNCFDGKGDELDGDQMGKGEY